MPEVLYESLAERERAEQAIPDAIEPPDPAEFLATRATMQVERMADIYRTSVSQTSVTQAPDTTFWTAGVQTDEVLTGITDEALTFFATIYGGENMGPFVTAHLLADPVQRERTLATLEVLRETTSGIYAPGAGAFAGEPDELLRRVLNDETAFEEMSVNEKAAVAGIATDLLGTLENLPNVGVARDIERASYISTTGDTSLALSEAHVEILKAVIERLGGLQLGGTSADTPEFMSIGIEQVRQLGQGQLVLDEEWARAHPVDAFATQQWLEQNYPEMTITYGKQGVFGSLLDKFAIAVDYLSAPFGAALNQATEFAEGFNNSPEQRQRALETADMLEQQVSGGEIAEDRIEDALRQIAFLRDIGTVEVGMQQFAEDVYRNTAPRTLGFGFADSATRAANLLPGDPEYGFVYAVTGLAANIVADPLNFILPGIGAVRASRTIPKVRALAEGALGTVDELAEALRVANPALDTGQAFSRATALIAENTNGRDLVPILEGSWLKNAMYRRIARYPEEIAVTRPFMRAQSRLWRLRESLGQGEFSAALGQMGLDAELARYLSQTRSLEDMQIAMVRAMTGVNQTPLNVDALVTRLDEVTQQLDGSALLQDVPGVRSVDNVSSTYTAHRADLIAQRAWLEDSIRGRDWASPMRQVFTSKQLRRLERLSDQPLGIHGRVIASMLDFTDHFPANAFHTFGARQYREADTAKSAEQFMAEFGHMWRDTGAGDVLTFPHTSRFARAIRQVGGEVLEGSVESSFDSIVNVARFFGLSKREIRELMAPWTSGELTSAMRSFEWWKKTWETMIDSSTKLTSVGKAELRQMWRSYISDRSPGFITETVGGFDTPSATLFRTVTDPNTGMTVRSGVPAFEADQFQTWRIPTLADLREHMTVLGRTMSDWAQAGGAGKRHISLAHLGMSQTWSQINSMWRSTTLGFRLFGALPARIGMEQMLRIAAYGYASAVWHPVEWFASTRLGTKLLDTDFVLFADSPTHVLGAMVDAVEQHPNFVLARAGRETVTFADGAPYYRAYSERLGRMFASPSVHRWHLPHLGDSDTTLGVMRNGRHAEEGEDWLALYDQIGMAPEEAVRRTQLEISQMIGEGPGSELVRVALQRGAVTVNGDTIRVGTSEFATWLESLVPNGWRPASTYLARSAGDYLPAARIPALRQFRDKLFRVFYAGPDLALSRSPLFRQIAAREYGNLVRMGYRPENALRIARGHAAQRTADMMFTIGAKTSGEYFLRNVNPFFPAYRELAATWLKRLPMRVGEGHWGLGAAALARRGDVWVDFFKNLGVIRVDEQGKMYVPLPGLDRLVALMTGADIGFDVRAPLESFAGVLPVPIGLFEEDENGNALPWYKRLRGIVPSLGGPSSVGLGLLNDVFGDAFKDVENWLTLYGTDQSLGPLAVDRFAEAFGITMPWMTGTTRDYHEAVRTWSVIDGMRIAWAEMPPPDREQFDANGDGDLTPEEQAAWAQAHTEWAEKLVQAGEGYAQGTYLLRGIAGMTMPFSIQIEDENKQQMSALWALINTLPDEGGPLRSALIESVLAEYPNLEPYMVGKNQDTRIVDDPDSTLDEFMQAVKDGEIKIRSPQDWAIFAYGMNAYSVYQSRIDSIYEEAGGTAAEWLVNFDAKSALATERAAWEDFLDLTAQTDNFLPGQTQSFEDMFNTYQGYIAVRDGESPRLSLQQQQLLDFDRAMKEFALYFSPNPDSSEEYYRLREQAFEALGNAGQSDLAKGVSWWYENVSDPYYTALDRLYDKLDITEPRNRALVFQQIRDLANEYNQPYVHDRYGDFPTPEEYLFTKLNPEDRRRQVTEWTNLPATFLTEFQREQVGYTIPEGKQDEANNLASFITRAEHKFDRAVVQYDISTSSTAYSDARDKLDALFAERAENAGLGEYWRELNAPVYQRLDSALGLSQSSAVWRKIVRDADAIRAAAEAAGVSLGASNPTDQVEIAQRLMVNIVQTARANDQQFDSLMAELAVNLGEEGQPLPPQELVLQLFFEPFSTSQYYHLDQGGNHG